jgi:hypothetical protein
MPLKSKNITVKKALFQYEKKYQQNIYSYYMSDKVLLWKLKKYYTIPSEIIKNIK